MQITITSISRKERTSKAGKPYTSLGLKCQEYGDKWLSGFGRKDNANWQVGDTVEVEIKQAGEYLNFEMPNKEAQAVGAAESRVMNMLTLKIEPQLQAIYKELVAINGRLGFEEKSRVPKMDNTNDGHGLDDLPFDA